MKRDLLNCYKYCVLLVFLVIFTPQDLLSARISYQNSLKTAPEIEAQPPRFSFALLGGVLDYPSVANLSRQNGAGGVALGLHLGANFFVQGDFLYSFQQSSINRITLVDTEDIDHYLFSVNLKYDWVPLVQGQQSWFHIYTGVIGTHSRRQFNFDENSSYGFDGGASVELGFDLTRHLQVGFEYRYLMNISYERNFSNTQADLKVQNLGSGSSVKSIENFDHQYIILSSKFRF